MSELLLTGEVGNMAITVDELVGLHPTLFHMAEEGTWESIRDNGLMSTSALLDRFRIEGEERKKIEEKNRRTSKTITHRQFGSVVIRDQIPMTDSALGKCLTGLTPAEWYKTLNSKVFFWPTADRLSRLFNARAYRGKIQTILEIDTKTFLDKYNQRVLLSPINSGSTIMKPQPRGAQTFLPMNQYPFEEWRKKRSRSTAIAEITVDYSVPDIKNFIVGVVHMKDKEIVKRFV